MGETHWKKNFDYKFTGAYELLNGEQKTVTIQRTTTEDVMSTSGQKQRCFVAYFKDQSKPMVLNKTNCKTIEKMYGPIIENWIGKSIIIESKRVKAFGEEVDALRVKHSIPKTTELDVRDCINKIELCESLSELKSLFLSFPPPVQAAVSKEKDKKKAQLEGAAQ